MEGYLWFLNNFLNATPASTALAAASPAAPTFTATTAADRAIFVWSITGSPNSLNTPTDLATDGEGNLYVVDAGNDRIQVFDPDGKFSYEMGPERKESRRIR